MTEGYREPDTREYYAPEKKPMDRDEAETIRWKHTVIGVTLTLITLGGFISAVVAHNAEAANKTLQINGPIEVEKEKIGLEKEKEVTLQHQADANKAMHDAMLRQLETDRANAVSKAKVDESMFEALSRKAQLDTIMFDQLRQKAEADKAMFEAMVRQEDAISACYEVAGEFDFMLILTATSMDEYHGFTRRVFTAANNVRNFKSLFAMNCAKFETRVPL